MFMKSAIMDGYKTPEIFEKFTEAENLLTSELPLNFCSSSFPL